jgi:hypothetical protein
MNLPQKGLAMSTETRTGPIVVRIPPQLGLTDAQAHALESKWAGDLQAAVAGGGAKIKWSIEIKIKIGNE